MCSDADCGESAGDFVPVVAGDSLSLFSPCEVLREGEGCEHGCGHCEMRLEERGGCV